MRAQRLQRASAEFLRNVAVWFDMIGNAGSDDLAFAQAHRTKRLALKLTTRSEMPRGLVMQPAHSTKSPADSSASLYYQLAAFRFGNATTQNVVSNTNEIFSAEVPTITMSSSAANMSERGNIWLSRGFSESRLRESAQGDKWSFCLTAGKIGPRIRREHEQKTAPEPCIGL